MYQLLFFCQETHYLPPRQDSKSLDELQNWARTVSYTGTHTQRRESSAGFLATRSETALVELGTDFCLWLVHRWVNVG